MLTILNVLNNFVFSDTKKFIKIGKVFYVTQATTTETESIVPYDDTSSDSYFRPSYFSTEECKYM